MAHGVRRHRIKNSSEQTWASQSIIHYGEPSGANLIRSSNPGFSEPLPIGKTITVPDRPPLTGPTVPSSANVGPDEVELRVDGERFRHWTNVDITRTLDAVATVQVRAPQARTIEFVQTFEPLSYQDMLVMVGGRQLFTGTMMDPTPMTDADQGAQISVGGYSRAGVLGDCTMPVSAYPLQWKNVALPVIAQRCAEPFSLQVDTIGDIGGEFRRVRLKSDKKILSFLTDLAKQRKVLIGSTPEGRLLLRAPPEVSTPVAVLREGTPPFLKIQLRTEPQKHFSHLTVLRKKARRVTPKSYTVVNEALAGVMRPMITKSQDTNSSSELPTAAEALAGRTLAGAATWMLKVNGWRDQAGDIWEPGATVNVADAPSGFIFGSTDLIIRACRYSRSDTKTTTDLELVLPGAFTGVLPEVYPWQV